MNVTKRSSGTLLRIVTYIYQYSKDFYSFCFIKWTIVNSDNYYRVVGRINVKENTIPTGLPCP